MKLGDLLNKRTILVSGKGGVGRTTMAAALALAGARHGKRVLVTEVGDPEGGTSPLAQLFDRQSFEPSVTQLLTRLDACCLWPRRGHELFLRSVLPAGALVAAGLRSRALGTFLDSAPSFQEMGIFYHLLTLLQSTRPDGHPLYDTVVIDMPATGHALALTGLPDILHRLIPSGPIRRALEAGQELLYDADKSAAVVVALPEVLPVSEAMDLAAGLRENGMPIGGILLNRFPENPFDADETAQLTRLLATQSLFGGLAFHRIQRSREQLLRLENSAQLSIWPIPERAEHGHHLVRALAGHLLAKAQT